jgi:cytochrome c oxidase assembly protein subunit 15
VIPLLLILTQVALGVFAVVLSPGIIPNHWGAFDWMAQLHQVVGMLFALSLVELFYVVRRR